MSNFPHEDRDRFVESVRYTAGKAQFSEALVEKDYFCSLILREIFSNGSHQLVFKGGTLLNKTHAGFYRLSEDLDFSIGVPGDVTRTQRRILMKPVKGTLTEAVEKFSFRFSKPLDGKSESTQYQGEIEYQSLLLGTTGTIKIDIGLREDVLEAKSLRAKTLLEDPFSGELVFEEFEITGLSCNEAYAEKIRAAMSREYPAIRDIFDLHYAVNANLFNPNAIKPLVKHKFDVQRCTPNLSADRKAAFAGQIETHLRPVLRTVDFERFDFEKAWNTVCSFERLLKSE